MGLEMIIALLIMITIFLGIVFDLLGKISLMNIFVQMVYLLIYPNILLILAIFKSTIGMEMNEDAYGMFLIFFIIGYAYIMLKIHVFPVPITEFSNTRANIMLGGRIITYCGIYAFIMYAPVNLILYQIGTELQIDAVVLATNNVVALVSILLLFLNGTLRIYFTSSRLGIKMRIMMLCVIWIPVVNIIYLMQICKMIYDEYDYMCNNEKSKNIKHHSNQCKTKYPVLLVHSLGFRDLRYFNYWGRIPIALTMNGAEVYYAHYECFGTILNNAQLIKNRIEEIVAETGCEKVNIIAHSKGGLDARYAVRMYDLKDKVASLTTIATPHRGCKWLDKVCNMSERVYRIVARYYDSVCKKADNIEPDFYTATKQFTTEKLQKFNANVTDCDGVYYQSYACRINGFRGNGLLGILRLIVKHYDGDNDGIVGIESAKWGTFKGIIECSGKKTGISHADIVDFKRKDFEDYDILEKYIEIVNGLKKRFL